jgi:alkanesulfonate monooxygenase SsuD/methylene tetrahydromethanopterin reductase-like flavin-dependent oxidoreductase (luciferase family)
MLEGWTALTYFAALQPQLQIGHIVLSQSFRNPALLAKMAATMQYLSGGRFMLGIGAGWKEDEYRSYGYDYPSPGTRIAELEESVQIIKALWTEKQATVQGKHYQIVDAYCEPKPDPIPPIIIGGSKPRMLRLIARYADWWSVSRLSLDVYREKVADFERACDVVGRDSSTLKRAWFGNCICAENEAELRKFDSEKLDPERNLIGTPRQVIEKIQSYVDLGGNHFELVLPFDHPLSKYCYELFASEVLPVFEREVNR